MKSSFLEKSKRALVLLLTGAMIATSVPSTAFAATVANDADDVIIEEAVDAVADEAIVEEEVVADEPSDVVEALGTEEIDAVPADDDALTARVFTGISGGNIAVNYGDTVNAEYAVTSNEFSAGHTSFTYWFGTFKAGKSAADLVGVNTESGFEAVLDHADLPLGFTHTKDGNKVKVGGTAMKIFTAKDFVLVVHDTAGTTTKYSGETSASKVINIGVSEKVTNGITFDSQYRQNAGTIAFGKDDNDATAAAYGDTVKEANAGYSVRSTKLVGATEDNVRPVKITITSDLDPDLGDFVNAEIKPFDEVANTTSSITSGDESKNAFVVTPEKSTKKLGNGQNAVFTVKPVEGLAAKVAASSGTTYKAKLVLTSEIFNEKTYTLEFKVVNQVGVKKVVTHGGTNAPATQDGTTGDGKPYNLGTFKIGEEINDVVITVGGGKSGYKVTSDNSELLTIESNATALEELPSGLSLSAGDNDGEFKVSGKIESTAYDYLGTNGIDKVHYFAITPEDGNGVKGTKKYFKYTVSAADLEITINNKDYNKDTATKMTVGSAGTFAWYGDKASTITDNFITVYVKNKSKTPITFTNTIAAGVSPKGKISFATTSEKLTSGITIDGESSAEIKVYPYAFENATSDLHAHKLLTIAGQGVKPTPIELEYEGLANFEITKPKTNSTNIGTAYLGKDFAYTFEATNVAGGVSSIIWNVTGLTDSTNTFANKDAADRLRDVYGLELNKTSGKLMGVLKKTDTGNLTVTVTAGSGTSRSVLITTAKPTDGLTLTSNGVNLKAPAKLDLGTVGLNAYLSGKAKVDIENATKIEQTSIRAAIASVDGPTSAGNEFKIVYDEANASKNAAIVAAGGLTLGATENKSGSFVVVPDASKITKAAGKYTIGINVTGDNITTQTITAIYEVKAEAEITPDVQLGNGTIKAEKTYSEANALKYTTSYGGTRQATYELVSGTVPSTFKLDPAGFWYGKIDKVGKYSVTVKATTTDLAEGENVSATITHDIVVSAVATLTVVTTTGSNQVDGKSYILEGEKTGYTANANKLKLTVKNITGDGKTVAKNVTVTVKDAADDRGPGEDLDNNKVKDVIEHPENPYTGSVNVLGISNFTASNIDDTEGLPLSIITKAGAQAGAYKVNVTVSADNASPVSFDVLMFVTNKLVIKQPANFTGQVGDVLGENSLVLEVEGGYAGQMVTWKEAGTNIGGANNYYVTPAAGPHTGGNANTTTGFKLEAENKAIGDAEGLGVKNRITGTIKKATLNESGTVDPFVVTIGASTSDVASGDLGAKETAIIGRFASTGRTSFGAQAKAIVGDDAESKVFNITVNKSSKPKVTDIAYKGKTPDDDGFEGTVIPREGSVTVGKNYEDIAGYTWPEVVYNGTNYSANALTIDISDLVDGALEVTPSFTTNKSNFTLSSTGAMNATSHTVTVTPNAKLTPGTYTDTITFKGDNVSDITFALSFTVVNETYAATVDNNIKSTDTANISNRKVYAENVPTAGNNDYTGTTKVEPESIMASALSAGTAMSIAVRNAGNSELTNIAVKEVNKSGSAYVIAPSPVLALTTGDYVDASLSGADIHINPSAGTVDVPAGKYGTFKVAAKAGLTKGVKDTYIEISFSDGTATGRDNIYLPVEFVVVNNSIAANTVVVTPSEDSTGFVNLTGVNEGYKATEAAKDFTISNSGSGDAETLKGLTITCSGADSASFSVLKGAAADLKGGDSRTITVRPVEGLAEGTYTTTLTVSAANLPTSVTRQISFKVAKSNDYTFNFVTTDGQTTVSQTVAERLYNTIWSGLYDEGNSSKVSWISEDITNIATGKHVFELDLDQDTNTKEDVIVEFNGTKATSTNELDTVASATITLAANNTITKSSGLFELTEAQVTKATSNGIGSQKCFKKVDFKLYAKIVYGTTLTTEYKETKEVLDNDYVLAQATVSGTDKRAKGTITTFVPVGGYLGDAFTGGKLPTAELKNNVFNGWMVTFTGGSAQTATETVRAYKDGTVAEQMYPYTYSTGSDKDTDTGVKWTWSYANSKLSAVLELTDVTGRYDADSLITIDENTAETAAGTVVKYNVANRVTIEDNGSVEATCTKGSRKEYKATAKIWNKSGSVTNIDADKYIFTSTYSMDEQNDAKGHTWGAASIDWDNPNADGTYNVTYTCADCGEHVVVKATASDEVTLKATCETDGSKVTTLSWKVPDKKGNASAETATDKKTLKIDALGHTYKLEIEWNEDHKTVKKAELVCTVCDETEKNHTVNVLSSVKYDVKTDSDGKVTSNTAKVTYNGIDYEKAWYNHEHVWTATWADWARTNPSDKFSWATTLTMTCTVGESPEEEKPDVKISSTKTEDGKYIDYTAVATFEGKEYKSELTVDAETGEITSKHEHKWAAPSWKWNSSADAIATFTCSVGKETKDVTATITSVKTNSKGNTQYKATVTGPDGKAYEDLKWYDASGNPTSGEGIGIEGLETEYEFTGKQIKPAFIVVDYSIDKTLALGVDYTVKYGKNVEAGEKAGSVTITGKGNYDKQTVSESFDIVDPFKDADKDNFIDNVASITLPKATYFYDGTPKMPATITIKSKAKPAEVITATLNAAGDGYEFATDSKEAYISVSNNINKGSATVSVRGKNDTKAKTKNFSIKALDLTTVSADDLTFAPDDAVYAVKGAVPANLNVEYKGTPLVLGQDYTVKYSYTSKTKDAGDDAGSFKITGKGNFAKAFGTEQKFNIVPLTLEDDAVSVAAYDKANGAKLQATVADGNGVKIPAKQLVVTCSKAAKLAANDEIEVTVKGANEKNISGEVTLNIKVAENLKTAKVAIAKDYAVQYTGEAINLEELEKNPFEDGTITVTAKNAGALEYGTDFEIAGYVNNVKKGNMTVILRGKDGKVSGNKEVKIKISPKTVKKAE